MKIPIRVVVTGLAATYPLGGVFWDYLQYVLGFWRVGSDVLYLEDTGKWCYDPSQGTFVEDGANNARYLRDNITRLDPALAGRWFYRDAAGHTFGRAWPDVVRFCRTADLFLNVSATCWMREEYFAAARTAFIDSDPMYTQASIPDYVEHRAPDDARRRIEQLKRHNIFFTFGENIGAPDCLIPTEEFHWIPTRQPIVIDKWKEAYCPIDARPFKLTTVSSWEPHENGPLLRGVAYSGKSREFRRFMDLPSRCKIPLEVAMSGRAPSGELRKAGWNMIDGYSVSSNPWIYRSYLANSAAEWSVAKNAYVDSRSGWFSCRTACYLAAGVPAIVQDTGFRAHIPAGDGVLSFSTLEEAADAIERVTREPKRHEAAARYIAREYFDHNKVLSMLVQHALERSPSARFMRDSERLVA